MVYDSQTMGDDFEKVLKIIEHYKTYINPSKQIEYEEFQARLIKVQQALVENGFDLGFVFADESHCGNVPYLAGNTNITIEQVAGVVGSTGFHVIAGLEGGYVAEQLSPRSGVYRS